MTMGHLVGAFALAAAVYYIAKKTNWNLPVLG